MGGQTVEVGARRLLIVDDDTEVCAVIGDIAEEQGYEVTATDTGAEFMARYPESHPTASFSISPFPIMTAWSF